MEESVALFEGLSRERGEAQAEAEGGISMEQAARIRRMDSKQATTRVRMDSGAVQGRLAPLHSPPSHSAVRLDLQLGRGAASGPLVRTPRAGEFLIRLLDIVGSLAILVLALPVMIVSALLIKITSAGPVFYKQERVGQGGKLFTLCKFRTMINDAEKHVGPVLATKDDERVTPVGRILRQTRIDELPQIYNVLRGDMSLVGPRPERAFFIERHKALEGVRLSVRPGLTGLAQVRSYYDLKPAHKVRYDYLYIQNRSLLLNIYILLQTIPVLFAKKGW
jgi:lipopolysaccharide/colanic/teichoic acid biosynthesis glycosyltransferase